MAELADAAGPTRYFLALRPDDPARERLAGLCHPGDGRCLLPADLHLTLAFLGDLRAPSAESLMEGVEVACRQGPVDVALDRLEAWRGPRALCALGDLPAVAALVDALWGELRAFGYVRDTRPFRAHVTLARNLPAAACRLPTRPIAPPIRWVASELWLLASRSDAGCSGQPRYVSQALRRLA